MEPIKSIIKTYFRAGIRNLTAIPLNNLWIRFSQSGNNSPSKDLSLAFTFTVLLHLAMTNGVIIITDQK